MESSEILKKSKFDIQDVFYLENLEQLQAISDPLRYRMIVMLTRPMTGAQLARALDLSRARAHYHLKYLERVGVVRYYGEGQSHGITEKYYQVVGRMLDFSHLIPGKEQSLIPTEVTLETYNAIGSFLATMLDVSKESLLRSEVIKSMGTGFWFDFASILTPEQIDYVGDELASLKQQILEMTRKNRESVEPRTVVEFRTTLFLTLLSEQFLTTEQENGDDEVAD